MKPRFTTLDALRGLMAVVVLIEHCLSKTTLRLFPYGWLAVDVFFILSGFVLAHAYADRVKTWADCGRFLWARVRRLYPLYFLGLVLGAFSVLGPVAWQSVALGVLCLPDFSGTVIQYGADTRTGYLFPFNGPSWSLWCEMAVNVAWGAMLVLRVPARYLLAAGLLAWGVLESLYGGWTTGTAHLGLVRVAIGFPLGVMAYEYRAYLGIGAFASGLSVRWLSWLGGISYALYVIHMPVIQLVRQFDPMNSVGTAFAVAGVCVGLAAILTSKTI